MKKKKVLFVVHQLNFGGVQKSLISALNAIDYDENEVTLYIRKNRVNLLNDVNEKVKNIIINDDRTHYYRKPYVVILMLLEFIFKCLKRETVKISVHQKLVDYINESQMKYEEKSHFRNREKYDVAVSYIQGYTSKFVGDYINADKKIVLYHSSTDEKHELHMASFKQYDLIAGVNERVGDVLKEAYPQYRDKIDFFENYVDPILVRKTAEKDSLIQESNKLTFCTCGRLAKEKGFDLAVDAAYELKKSGFDFRWYFVGDGPEKSKLEKKISELGLEKNILITGMQLNPYKYIKNCDVYIQPSYEESYGLTIAEAKILCKPIVSTRTIGGKLQIEENKTGMLVDSDGSDIALAMERYLADNEFTASVIENLMHISYDELCNEYKSKWKKALEV